MEMKTLIAMLALVFAAAVASSVNAAVWSDNLIKNPQLTRDVSSWGKYSLSKTIYPYVVWDSQGYNSEGSLMLKRHQDPSLATYLHEESWQGLGNVKVGDIFRLGGWIKAGTFIYGRDRNGYSKVSGGLIGIDVRDSAGKLVHEVAAKISPYQEWTYRELEFSIPQWGTVWENGGFVRKYVPPDAWATFWVSIWPAGGRDWVKFDNLVIKKRI